MKKFCITLFILLILGGLVFFFGWAQLQVPPGAYGIIRSKTHGVDPRPVRAGEFRWLWYKLIPANVEIAVFRLEPVNYRFSAGNTLPSGDTYAAFAGTTADFSWEINASLTFSIDSEVLVKLVSDNTIGGQDALNAWATGLAERISGFILSRLSSGETNTRQLEEILTSGSSAELEREVRGQFPEAGNFSCMISAARFPDFALYNQVRFLYEDFIARQREYMSAALNRKAESRIDTQLRFEELKQYGELLAKYPILLDFLALERGIFRKSE
jgi:hypothetical protein